MCIRKSRGALVLVNLAAALLVLAMIVSATGASGPQPPQAAAQAPRAGYLSNLLGATYDQATGDLILFGGNIPSLPALDKHDLTVALRTRFDPAVDPQDFWPGVTMGFNANDQSAMDVIYFGKVYDTRFGYVLFESDRLLKSYGLGYDNSTGAPVPINSTVPGYQSEPACLSGQGFSGGATIRWRKWLSPALAIQTSADRTAVAFSRAGLKLNWAYESQATHPAVTHCAQAFVDHFNAHYRQFADEQLARGNPALHELVQLAKLTAIAEWLWNREPDVRIHGLNSAWLNGAPVPPHTTPNTTPRINVQQGALSQSGAVDLTVPFQSFVPDTALADRLGRAARDGRPARQENWDFCAPADPPAQTPEPEPCQYSATAAAIASSIPYTARTTGAVAACQPRGTSGFCFEGDGTLELELVVPNNAQTTRATFHDWKLRTTHQNNAPAARGPAGLDGADTLTVRLITPQGAPILLEVFTGEGAAGFWVPGFDYGLTAYRGQRITLQYEAQMDAGSSTAFHIGAIELNADPPPFAQPPTPTPTSSTPSPTRSSTPSPTPTSSTPSPTPSGAPPRQVHLPFIRR